MVNTATNSLPVSQLPNTSVLASTDRIVVLYNASSNVSVANGSPSVRTIAFSDFTNNSISNNTPLHSSSNGTAGTFAYDNTYFYVCISNNNWIRTSLSSSW